MPEVASIEHVTHRNNESYITWRVRVVDDSDDYDFT